MTYHMPVELITMSKAPKDRNESDLTERVLLSLVFDVTCLQENVEQVKVKVLALCREHGISTPPAD